MRTQTTRTIGGRVNANGTIAAGDGFIVQKGAVGVYTVAFPTPFRVISMVANSAGGSFVVSTATGAPVTIYNSSTLAQADAPFSFVAVGAT